VTRPTTSDPSAAPPLTLWMGALSARALAAIRAAWMDADALHQQQTGTRLPAWRVEMDGVSWLVGRGTIKGTALEATTLPAGAAPPLDLEAEAERLLETWEWGDGVVGLDAHAWALLRKQMLEVIRTARTDAEAEVERLRGLLERLVLTSMPHGPEHEPHCPRDAGGCWWCSADLDDEPPEPHKPPCPWPELEAAVLSWRV